MNLSKRMDHMNNNQMNNQMLMNQMNNQMMMNQMNNQMLMNQMNNQIMINQMKNQMMMNRVNNSSKMVIPMMMNGINNPMFVMNPMIIGGRMNMMTKEQIELHKQQKRYQGYLAGKKMAKEKKRKEQALNPQTVTSNIEQNNSDTEITIRFNKAGNIKNIKMKSEAMIAELLNAYSTQTGNQGTFQYKGAILNIEDGSTLNANGMRNGNLLIPSINYYVFLYVINGALLIISLFLLGKEFFFKTAYGSIMLPTFVWLVGIICKAIGFDVQEYSTGVEAVLISVFAAVLMGLGIGLNIRAGGSTGGFDIIESILNKYLHVPFSTSVYILDAIVIGLGMWVYDVKIGNTGYFMSFFEEGLNAVVYVFIMGYVMDLITFGGVNKRAVFIRSEKYEEIHDIIIYKLYRGMTYIEAEGGYSKTPTKMIICICYTREYFLLRNMIEQVDPNAFIFATRATEVRGLGFSIEEPPSYNKRRKEMLSKKETTSK